MNDVVTILGLCCVDRRFRLALQQAPVPTALQNFRLLNEEAARLERVVACFNTKETWRAFDQIYEVLMELDARNAGTREPPPPEPLPCCPEPPCDMLAIDTEKWRGARSDAAKTAR